MHMGTPPGYAAYYPWSGEIADWAKESPDYERWKNLPPEVEKGLRDYYEGVRDGRLEDRTAGFAILDEAMDAIKVGKLEVAAEVIYETAKKTRCAEVPCLWFDTETKRCRHYEYRPETCRDPDVMFPGNEACRATRRHFGIK